MKNRRQVLSMLGFGTLAVALGGATAFVARASNFEQMAADAIGKPAAQVPWAGSFSARAKTREEFELTAFHVVFEQKSDDVERIFAVHWKEQSGPYRQISEDRLFAPQSAVRFFAV